MSASTDLAGFHLYVKDCVAGMKEYVPSESIDLVVTSPPYNIGIKYASYDDRLSKKDYLKWTTQWVTEVRRCLKPDGSFFLNIAGSLKEPLLPHQVITLLVEDLKLFHLQNTIHWIKSIAIPGKDGIERQRGHYKPINSERFVNDCHEYIFHLTPHGDTRLHRLDIGIPYADKSNIARWGSTNGQDLKCRGNNWFQAIEQPPEEPEDSNTWFVPYKTISRRAKDRPHPATFPTEVAAKCIKLHGNNASAIVMDPFLGIGHTALASARCNVAGFIGFDIEKDYAEVALAELSECNWPAQLHE